MKPPLTIIRPRCLERGKTTRLDNVLQTNLASYQVERIIENVTDLTDLAGRRLLFAVNLGASGVNLSYYAMLKKIRTSPDLFQDCLAGVVVDGESELYTKSVSRELVFAANQAGCAFVGRPLVEATGSLTNFHILAQINNTDEQSAYRNAVGELLNRLTSPPLPPAPSGELLVLHASSHPTSNTMALWQIVREQLSHRPITELGLRNGEVADCSGCPYTTCLHFGEGDGCFYGGPMTQEVFPAVRRCATLLMLCPNYNDALSANLTAFINRLTGLFRQMRFYDKRLYALVVSGYSGSDIVAEQLIAALNMNKTFFLPPRFCMTETANNAGSILQVPGIRERAAAFAEAMV